MREVGEIEAVLSKVRKVDFDKILEYEVILIGSPNYFGGPVRGIRKFIDKLGEFDFGGKSMAVFDTCVKTDFEKAVKKMEKRIDEKITGVKLALPGLSIKVKGLKGPIIEEEFPRCKEFGHNIANKVIED